MKYKILLSLLLFFGLKSSSGLAQCVNGTETTPIPTGTGFKTNTFDWRINPIPINGKFITTPSKPNPFFNTVNYLQALQGGLESNSKPSDGWQLIKQDFGYAYAGSSWNGQTLFQATGFNQEGRAYMMLYNKYNGTLRIIGLLGNLSVQDQIVVELRLKGKDLSLTNQNQFEFSALFNRYNQQETALDLTTKVTKVTAPAQVPGTGGQFFYADFILSYDPCICFFKSAIEVDFKVKLSSTLKLTGRILGQSVDVANENALPSSPDYLTSVINDNTSDQPFNQQYKTLAALQTKLQTQSPTIAGTFSNYVGILAKGAKIAKGYDPAISAFGTAFSFLKSSEVDKLGKTSSFFDFISIFMGKDEKASNPSVITAELAANGRIESTSKINGSEIFLGTPGSKDANLLDEYIITQPPWAGLKPMYPMYNEIPGSFAVVRTPEVLYSVGGSGPNGDSTRLIFKLSDVLPTISYAFNPIVDAEKTRVFVALEFKNTKTSEPVLSKFLPIENARNMFGWKAYYEPPPTGVVLYTTPENFNVVFQIFYQFKPNANGEIKVGQDIVKVKPKLTFTPNLKNDVRFTTLLNTPTDLNLGATVFSQGQTIYSFGDITITGNLTNNSSQPIIIIAQGDVNINPGVDITGNIEIRTGQTLPIGFPVDPPLPPLTATEIQTFCTSSIYKAKDQTLALAKNDPTTDKDDVKGNRYKNLIFTISPNPFTNQITVDLNIEEATTANLDLSNAVGQTLKSMRLGVKEKGSYQETIETNDLAPGIYFLTLRTQNGTETRKIVKQ
jgi:hypothetical protein